MPKFKLQNLKKYSILLVLVGLMAFFSTKSPYFLTWPNISNIIMQNTYFIIAGVGLAFVMIGGGIDLSVGWIMSLVGVVTAILMVNFEMPVWFSVSVGLLLGTLLGAMNGLIVEKLKIFSLIATLASGTVFRGISYMLSGAQTIRNYPESFLMIVNGSILNIHYDLILAIVVVLFATILFNKTYFGRYILALGGNEEASRLVGIKTGLVKVAVFAMCGFFTALGTMVMIAKANTTSSAFGPGTEFVILTAAIVGGISFKGGEGSMWGLVTGIFILQVLANGMQLAGWGTYAQYIVTGTILVAAVAFDEYQKTQRVKRIKEAKNKDEPTAQKA